MKASITSAVVLLALVASACSSGSPSTPTAPTPPVATTPPAPPPPPAPAARLVVSSELSMIACINGLCSFSGWITNTGDACAANIRGETFILSAAGVEVGRARWQLIPIARVIRPGEEFSYYGVGMPQIVLNHLDGRYYVDFFFDSRPC